MTQASPLDIHLLLAGHDDQTPVVKRAIDGVSSAREPRPAMPDRHASATDEHDRDDLQAQGWGVVAPPGAVGDRLLDLVAPLVERRAEQQQAEVRVFRSSPSSTNDLSLLEAFQWRNRWNAPDRPSSPALPHYLLILGDFEHVPLAVQRALSVSTNHAVGRLSFTHADQYRAYAAKLCAHDKQVPHDSPGTILMHTVRDDSPAIHAGYHHLLQPTLAGVQSKSHPPGAPIRELGSAPPSPDELFAAAAAPAPSVLFTLGHGVGAPARGWSSLGDQHRFQGALSVGQRARITGDDVDGRAFLPGGVWIVNAAFSAGTPYWSSYLGWLANLAEREHDGELARVLTARPGDGKPFLAALPTAALANPRGPIAFVGHVDLAWSHGFREPSSEAGSRIRALVDMIARLARGHRVGASMRSLFAYLLHVDDYLVSLYAADKHHHTAAARSNPAVERERALWWMIREQLAGYVLLGDPAARLAVRMPERRVAPTAKRAPMDTDNRQQAFRRQLEHAIAEYILGQPAAIALGRHGLSMAPETFIALADAFRTAGLAAIKNATP